VEMAGIEPASVGFGHRTSTSIVDLLFSHRQVASRRAILMASHWSPKAPLSRFAWPTARHLDTLSPYPTPAKEAVGRRVLLIRTELIS